MRFIGVAPKRPDQKFQPTADRPAVNLSNDFNIIPRSKAHSHPWWLSLLSLDGTSLVNGITIRLLAAVSVAVAIAS